jgi:SecY interacting protein Syd
MSKTMIQEFIQKWQSHIAATDLPLIEYDPEWPSPCEIQSSMKDNMIGWQPVAMEKNEGLEAVERGIEISLHPDIHQFYASYFNGDIAALHNGNQLWLLQAWNEQDFEVLQQNILGHLITKRRLKQSPTIFIAVTDEPDLNIVIKNQDGSVWLEYVGKEPHKLLADSLSLFLQSLSFEA